MDANFSWLRHIPSGNSTASSGNNHGT